MQIKNSCYCGSYQKHYSKQAENRGTHDLPTNSEFRKSMPLLVQITDDVNHKSSHLTILLTLLASAMSFAQNASPAVAEVQETITSNKATAAKSKVTVKDNFKNNAPQAATPNSDNYAFTTVIDNTFIDMIGATPIIAATRFLKDGKFPGEQSYSIHFAGLFCSAVISGAGQSHESATDGRDS